MPDVSIFNVAGTAVNVKDATARNTANQALNKALNLAQNIEDLNLVEVTYESASETIKITNGTPEKITTGTHES